MKLKLNKEFFMRHLFVAVLMAALGCWFGYDGYVKYPSMSPAELYRMIEKSDAPDEAAARKVYANAIPRQKQFMMLAFLASIIVGAHLFAVSRLDFAFDDDGFTFAGKRYKMDDIKSVDDSAWEKKRISKLALSDGRSAVLDAWHHVGVKEFHAKLEPAKA